MKLIFWNSRASDAACLLLSSTTYWSNQVSEGVKRFLLLAFVLLSVGPLRAFGEELRQSPVEGLPLADLTTEELDEYLQGFVLFDGICGYRHRRRERCRTLVTPSRLLIGDASIPLSSIQDVFLGSGQDFLYGDRLRQLATEVKRNLQEMTGIYYTDSAGVLKLAVVVFPRRQCTYAFNRTLQYARLGGRIEFERVRQSGPCMPAQSGEVSREEYW